MERNVPEKTPLKPVVFGEISHTDYSVSKVYFESLPGFFVTGNLYKPTGNGPFPAILSPHGHWAYGRLENSDVASVPGRAINLARQGFVVFTYDMIGYNDSRWYPHTPSHTYHDREFGGRRENLWGLSLAGLQLWNSIRAVDFLESLPIVARERIGATVCEIHTGPYAHAFHSKGRDAESAAVVVELDRIQKAGEAILDATQEKEGEFVDPVVLGAITVSYNLAGVDKLQLSPDVMAKIFQREMSDRRFGARPPPARGTRRPSQGSSCQSPRAQRWSRRQ